VVKDDQTGLTLRAVGDGHRAQNQRREAIDAYLQALVYLETGTYPLETAATHRAAGELYLSYNQGTEALAQLEAALAIEKSLPQQDGGRIVSTLQNLALAHELRGELDRAALRHHEALVYQDARHVPEDYIVTLRTLGRLYTQMSRLNEAAKAYEEALATETRQPAPDAALVDELTGVLADTYRAQGRLEA